MIKLSYKVWDTESLIYLSYQWREVIHYSVSKKILLGSIVRFGTEFNIAMPDENSVIKCVRNCAFDEGIPSMQLKEWSRNLNEDLLCCKSKY